MEVLTRGWAARGAAIRGSAIELLRPPGPPDSAVPTWMSAASLTATGDTAGAQRPPTPALSPLPGPALLTAAGKHPLLAQLIDGRFQRMLSPGFLHGSWKAPLLRDSIRSAALKSLLQCDAVRSLLKHRQIAIGFCDEEVLISEVFYAYFRVALAKTVPCRDCRIYTRRARRRNAHRCSSRAEKLHCP